MFEIRTKYGNFSRFKDLVRYMQEEGIQVITVETYYIFSPVAAATFTLEELTERIASGELI